METKKVDIFGSFLAGTPVPPSSPPGGPSLAEGGDANSPSPDLEKALLALLARSPEPMNLKVLLAHTMGSPTQVIKILEDLEKVGLVLRVEGEGDGRSYNATPLAKDLYSGS